MPTAIISRVKIIPHTLSHARASGDWEGRKCVCARARARVCVKGYDSTSVVI